MAVYSAPNRFCATEGGLCLCQKEKERQKVRERMSKARCKCFFSALEPALLISETATSHLSFVFSFRPSWSSSTPAYGTLLPWGRTMRRPLPVSPFFFSFIFSVLPARCRFRHTAKPALSVSFFLSPCYISIYRSFFLSY